MYIYIYIYIFKLGWSWDHTGHKVVPPLLYSISKVIQRWLCWQFQVRKEISKVVAEKLKGTVPHTNTIWSSGHSFCNSYKNV